MRKTILILVVLMFSGCTAAMINDKGFESADDSAQAAEDRRITAELEMKIYNSSFVGRHDIRVRTRRGAVTLTGSVDGLRDSQRVETLARGIEGVTMVHNRLDTVLAESDEFQR